MNAFTNKHVYEKSLCPVDKQINQDIVSTNPKNEINWLTQFTKNLSYVSYFSNSLNRKYYFFEKKVKDSRDYLQAFTSIQRDLLPFSSDKLNFKTVAKVVKRIETSILDEHRQQRRLLMDNTLGNNRKIIIKPSGGVYCCIRIVVSNFKIVEKGMLFGNISSENKFVKADPKFRVISIPHKMSSNSKKEFETNLYLKKMQKENKDLSNVNIIKSVSPISSNEHILINELYDGDVNMLIKLMKLTVKEKYFICAQMSKAIGQLHEVGIVHRDCKLDNFLYKLNELNEVVKIAITDFGLSGFIHNNEDDECIFFPISECNFPSKSFAPTSDIFQLGIAYLVFLNNLSVDEWTEIVLRGVDHLSRENNQIHNKQKILGKWKMCPEHWVNLRGEKLLEQIQDQEVKFFILNMLSPNRENRPLHQEITEFFLEKAEIII
jgi:hypothetical protein